MEEEQTEGATPAPMYPPDPAAGPADGSGAEKYPAGERRPLSSCLMKCCGTPPLLPLLLVWTPAGAVMGWVASKLSACNVLNTFAGCVLASGERGVWKRTIGSAASCWPHAKAAVAATPAAVNAAFDCSVRSGTGTPGPARGMVVVRATRGVLVGGRQLFSSRGLQMVGVKPLLGELLLTAKLTGPAELQLLEA